MWLQKFKLDFTSVFHGVKKIQKINALVIFFSLGYTKMKTSWKKVLCLVYFIFYLFGNFFYKIVSRAYEGYNPALFTIHNQESGTVFNGNYNGRWIGTFLVINVLGYVMHNINKYFLKIFPVKYIVEKA
jgi:hypothetical protein